MKVRLKNLLMSLIGLTLISCTNPTPKSSSTKGSTEQGMLSINPKSVVGYVGDPMPYYDDGEMNIFYLQDGRNTRLGFHPFALMTTTDYTTYHDYGVVIPYVDDLYSQDFALGTGSVIKDKQGLYHCFYTGHNDRKNSSLKFYEKIQHATSQNKITWNKIIEDGFYGDSNDFRDPYVYLGEDDIYHMLITTRINNCGVIKEYTSLNLTSWVDNGVFFKNDSGTYNMECPTFIKFNDYYYLSYSEQGNHRVTHYRYKKNLTDSWIKPETDFVDGEGLYAGRMEKDDSKLMMFGWCATRKGEYDTGELDWGGNLVVHELTQSSNGELNAKLLDSVKNKINHEVSYNLFNGDSIKSMDFTKDTFKAYRFESLANKITRISFDVNLNEINEGTFGLSFNTQMNHLLSNEVLQFNLKNKRVCFYANAKSNQSLGKLDTYIPYSYNQGKMNIQIVIDNQVISVYINEKVSLTTRFYDMPNNAFSFYSDHLDGKIENIRFYE